MGALETAVAVGALAAAVTAVWKLLDRIRKPMGEIIGKLDDLLSWQAKQQEDIEASKAEREILCGGVRALCEWAKTQGANGEISGALEDLNRFLSKRSHEGRSRL